MKLFPLAALALFSLAPGLEESPRFQPESGTTLAVDFESTLTIRIVGVSRAISIDGEDHPVPEGPVPEFKMSETETIRYRDEFQMAEGHPVAIKRHFEEVGNHFESKMVDPAGEDHGKNLDGESELEGATVQFAWEEDGSEYTATFGEDSSDLDEELLEGLSARADFAGFLSEEDALVGDEWEVPLSAYISITHLCGDLAITREDDEEGSDEYSESFDENLAGDFTATWKETIEEDGGRYAVILLRAELTTEVATEDTVSFNDVEGSEESTDSFQFGLEGELLWDLKGHRAYTLKLSGQVELVRERTQEFDMNGRGLNITEGTTFEGQLSYSAEVE